MDNQMFSPANVLDLQEGQDASLETQPAILEQQQQQQLDGRQRQFHYVHPAY